MDSMPPFQTPGFLVNLGGVLLCLTVSSFEALAVWARTLDRKGLRFWAYRSCVGIDWDSDGVVVLDGFGSFIPITNGVMSDHLCRGDVSKRPRRPTCTLHKEPRNNGTLRSFLNLMDWNSKNNVLFGILWKVRESTLRWKSSRKKLIRKAWKLSSLALLSITLQNFMISNALHWLCSIATCII